MHTLLATTAALVLAAAAAQAQTPAAAPTPQGGPATDVPVLANAQVSPDCGGLYDLAGRAFCVTANLGQIGALADAYIADLGAEGWLPAGGDDNRVVFAKRRDGGGCDGLQMIAFYDTAKTAVAELPAYLGFATIPGDVCSQAAPAAGTPPQ